MRILVVDDHQIVRRGVRSLLESSGLDVCGEGVDGRDAIQKALDLKPDAIVMDVSMPNTNGLDATREIKRLLPDVQIIMLSQHDSPEMKRQAFAAGAQGYVAKSAVSTDLLGALGRISQGGQPLLPAVVAEEVPNVDVQELLQRTSAFEAALRQSEQQVRSLVAHQSAVMNSMTEGLCALDAQGCLTSINPAGESILGWTKEELVGKKMHEVTHYKHPDGTPFPACDCPGLKVIEAGTSLCEHEDVFIRKDGAFVPVIFSASPLKEDGKTAGVILCFRHRTTTSPDCAPQAKARTGSGNGAGSEHDGCVGYPV